MNKILDLMLSYPDFQLNQVIDPDQVDLNNAQIVSKVNVIIAAINALTQGTTGAGSIGITPLPEFPSATTVQSALQEIATYCKANNTTINKILAKNTTQDTRLTALETTDANHTPRITALETDNTSNKSRLSSVESINTSQAQHLTTVDGRLSAIEAKNTTQDNTLNTIKNKNDEQDRTLVSHEVVMDSHARRISSVESVNTTQSNDITKIKGDIANINASNTNAEVVSARRTASGVQFDTIGKRMDYNEIGVGTALTTGQRGKMNMILTSSDDTEFWEDSASLGSISDHNASPDAHATLIANHELDTTSHQDIRDAIANIDVVTGWEDVQNKPNTFPPSTHTHTKSNITDFTHTHSANEVTGLPTSLPANGGNADTVDGKHASDFVQTSGGTIDGDLTLGGIRKLMWNAGRPNKSSIFWNASTSVNYGMVFNLDGTDRMYLHSDKLQVPNPIYCSGEIYVDGVGLKSSVSSGKTAVANAITAKGVATSNTAEFATMASNIGKIPTINNQSYLYVNLMARSVIGQHDSNTYTLPDALPLKGCTAQVENGSNSFVQIGNNDRWILTVSYFSGSRLSMMVDGAKQTVWLQSNYTVDQTYVTHAYRTTFLAVNGFEPGYVRMPSGKAIKRSYGEGDQVVINLFRIKDNYIGRLTQIGCENGALFTATYTDAHMNKWTLNS